MPLIDDIPVLDHGYVKLINGWGSDEGIVEAARMSTNKGFRGWGPIVHCKKCGLGESIANPGQLHEYMNVEQAACEHEVETKPGDEKLLRYLYENKHSTPFEMAGLTIEVKAPIFVFRQWHRHRTQSYNEMSARYTPLPNENYHPSIDRLMMNSDKNKQAGKAAGAHVLKTIEALKFQSDLAYAYDNAEETYQSALMNGIPKELARLMLPVGRYSRMRASANLRNWLGFLTLRMDPHAQYEIRVYADAIGVYIKQLFPKTWELFAEGMNA